MGNQKFSFNQVNLKMPGKGRAVQVAPSGVEFRGEVWAGPTAWESPGERWDLRP